VTATDDLGPTRYHWVPEVRQVVHKVLSRYPTITANTYVCHPWCGWGRFSVDLWGKGGRGYAIDPKLAELSLDFLFTLPGRPFIRHWIYEHTLWTSFGGYSTWSADDHSGNLRHVHVTYWRT
jgi:hypothetical protein